MSEPFDRLSHFGDIESLHALLDSTPYTKLLGIEVADEPTPGRPLREASFQRPARKDLGAEDGPGGESGAPVFVLRFSDDIIGNVRLPAIHGGVIGAFLETAALATLIWASDSEFLPKTIDISIEYLRSGKPRDTFAQATITKHGRRVANVRVTAWQEDPARPIAAAHGHFLIKPRENEGPAAGSGA
jgi:acyl-coenzyme A thioesterase PaaI-like protein